MELSRMACLQIIVVLIFTCCFTEAADPDWGDWGPFSKCTKTCGCGWKMRFRVCNKVPEALGGPGCNGSSAQLEKCNDIKCPEHGEWGSFSACSCSCGGGVQIQTRPCNVMPKSLDGPGCTHNQTSRTRECNMQPCTAKPVQPVQPVNVALDKRTVQSSTYDPVAAVSSHAVDGNTNGDYTNRSCSHTRTENNPWWRVDLGSCYLVSRIVVYNRVDCCSERLSNMQIRIGTDLTNNGNSNTVILSGQSLAGKEKADYSAFEPIVGRYVNVIQVGDKQMLSLCEVQVFGIPAACPTPVP